MFSDLLWLVCSRPPSFGKRIRKIELTGCSYPGIKFWGVLQSACFRLAVSSFAGGTSPTKCTSSDKYHEQVFRGPPQKIWNISCSTGWYSLTCSRSLPRTFWRDSALHFCWIPQTRKSWTTTKPYSFHLNRKHSSITQNIHCMPTSHVWKVSLIEECASPLRELSPRHIQFSEVMNGLLPWIKGRSFEYL